ncbi:transcriptional regulator, XRE family with cupin sensor [Natronincola peptidivorans]|uniref:Transcriptional regulator, XRE family with cupin sensor n=1 Tax=Natronincola peptidivorans TaxID=426128 RepID=A0A1I0FKB7_9FIRM|nr:XRE family transcriptional regulator [Natronincola peptidivorans]SET58744.1 transcriptional regulator, XRE family with cupin sensor [Natronincola peptidivorans]
MLKIKTQIGAKAKQLRQEKKITLKELSEKTNLSVGYLSQFERGINTIAIDTLAKIAEVYNVGLSYFFPNKLEENSVVLKSHEQEILDVIGENYIVTSLSTNNAHVLYPRLIKILPTLKTTEVLQTYPHQGEEFVYVLEGILTLLYKDKKHYLYPGDSAHYSSSIPHNWTNSTNKNVQILCISIPNPFNENNPHITENDDHLSLSEENRLKDMEDK